jgi:hypothetical protein
MSDWAEFGKEALKLWERPLFTSSVSLCAFLILLLLLFVPYLEPIRDPSIITIVVALGVLTLLFGVGKITQIWCEKRAQLKHLDSLTPKEAEVLLTAIAKGSQTIELPREEFYVAAQSLIKKGLLTPLSLDFKTCSFIVPRFVWDQIKKEGAASALNERMKSTA